MRYINNTVLRKNHVIFSELLKIKTLAEHLFAVDDAADRSSLEKTYVTHELVWSFPIHIVISLYPNITTAFDV